MTAFTLSPDRRTLATGEWDGRLRLWDITDPARGRPVGAAFSTPAPPAANSIWALAFSPDGRQLVAGSADGTLTWWNIADPIRPRRTIGPVSTVTAHPQPPDDRLIRELEFSRDGRLLLVRPQADPVSLWRVGPTGRPARLAAMPVALPQANPVTDAAISPSGRTVAVAAAGGGGVLWDIADPTRPRRLGAPLSGKGMTAAFSPDGRTLTTVGDDGAVHLWDMSHAVRTGTPPRHTGTLPVRRPNGQNLRFSPDGRWLLVDAGVDAETSLWALIPPQWPPPRGVAVPLGAPLLAVAVSSGDRWVATNGAGGEVRLWDIDTAAGAAREPVGAFRSGAVDGVAALAVSPDGRLLAVGGAARGSGVIEVWDVTDPRRPVRRAAPTGGTLKTVSRLQFDADGLGLAAADTASVVQWDLGAPTLTPLAFGEPSPSHLPRRIAISLPGRALAQIGAHAFPEVASESAPAGEQVTLQPIRASGSRYDLPGPGGHGSAVEFDPAGTVLAVGGVDGSLTLWDRIGWDAGNPHRRALPAPGHRSPVSAIGFAPDGRLAATAAQDGTLAVWLVTGNGPLRLTDPVPAHRGEITSVVFTPDGHTLLTGGRDGMLRRWDVTALTGLLADPTARACALASGGLSPEEWATFVIGVPYRVTCG